MFAIFCQPSSFCILYTLSLPFSSLVIPTLFFPTIHFYSAYLYTYIYLCVCVCFRLFITFLSFLPFVLLTLSLTFRLNSNLITDQFGTFSASLICSITHTVASISVPFPKHVTSSNHIPAKRFSDNTQNFRKFYGDVSDNESYTARETSNQ